VLSLKRLEGQHAVANDTFFRGPYFEILQQLSIRARGGRGCAKSPVRDLAALVVLQAEWTITPTPDALCLVHQAASLVLLLYRAR
jgi:hypothetical protein